MTRLPTPGQDSGAWGTILNDFLAQSHNTDGSLKAGIVSSSHIQDDAITADKIADSTITSTKLDAAVQSSLSKADTALQTAPVTSVVGQTGAITGAAIAGDVAFSGTYAARPVWVSDLVLPTYAAHRGGSDIAPEETLGSFTLAASLGLPIIDLDVWGSVEGVPFCIHDQTLDRTTTLTGNVSDRNASDLLLAAVDPSTWHSPGWPDTKLLTLEEVFRRFGGRAVLSIEIKDARSVVTTRTIALLQKYGLVKSVLINSYTLSVLTPFVAAGITCMLNNDTYTTTPATMLAAGVTWMGASAYVTTDAQITDAISNGMKVCVYTVERQHTAAAYIALGVHMLMGGNPLYVQGSPYTYRRTTDSFSTKTWGHGLLDSRNTHADSVLNSSGELVLTGTGSLEPSVVLGELSPVASPAGNYSITITIRLVSASTWAACGFAVSDDRPLKQGTTGYEALIRNTGSLELYRVNGLTTTQIGIASTTAIAANGTAILTVDVSPSAVSVTRTDVGPTVVSANDITYRGGYLHVAKQNLASEVRFSAISVA